MFKKVENSSILIGFLVNGLKQKVHGPQRVNGPQSPQSPGPQSPHGPSPQSPHGPSPQSPHRPGPQSLNGPKVLTAPKS